MSGGVWAQKVEPEPQPELVQITLPLVEAERLRAGLNDVDALSWEYFPTAQLVYDALSEAGVREAKKLR